MQGLLPHPASACWASEFQVWGEWAEGRPLSSREGAGGRGHGMVITALPISTKDLFLLRMWFSLSWKCFGSSSAMPVAWEAGPMCHSGSLWGEAVAAPKARRGPVRRLALVEPGSLRL